MQRMIFAALAILVLSGGVVAADEEASPAAKGKPALVVMDMQNVWMPMMDDDGKATALSYVNYAIAKFRERGLPIIAVYHTDPERGPEPGSEPFEFPEQIKITDDDIRVVKNFPSAFEETDLEKILREEDCDTVFLVGLSAVGCVLYTYFDSERLDFRTFMIEGALLSHDTELTHSVEEITGAVRIGNLEYMLLNAPN